MLVGLLTTVLAAASTLPSQRPVSLRLFAGDPRYQSAGGVETTFEGILERPSEHSSSYRLVGREGGQPVVWPLTLPDGPDRLADFVGWRVRVFGKLSGANEPTLWPARLMPVASLVTRPPDGILARSTWQPAAARQVGVRTFLFLDPAAVARSMNVRGPEANQTATTMLRDLLDVRTIDWQRQMVITVSAGLRGDIDRVRILRVERKGDTLTVFYKLEKSEPTSGGFGYPAETVLVERCDGPVRFVDEAAHPMQPTRP
jgi:hypothetical protein